MIESQDRVEQFKEEIASMKLRDPVVGRDRLLLRVGVVAMVGGIGLGIVCYFLSTAATNPLEQRDLITLALVGVAITVFGAALFVRYSIAQFLRFWLARLCYEQQAQTDRFVDAVTGAERDDPAAT